MNKKLEKIIHSKSFLIAMIVLLIILVISAGTYAWFTWSSTNNTNLTMSIGASSDVIFKNGNDISTNKLAPVFNYTDGEKTSFTITNKSTTSFSYRISLNITSIDNELKNSTLKYKLVSNNTVMAEGDFSNIESNSKNTLYEGELSKGNISYIFYLYINGNEENDLNMINKSLVGTITVAEATATYQLTNEDGTSYTPSYSGSGTKAVRSNAALSKFKEVRVDGVTVDSSNYTLTDGSTIVTFKESYLKTLSEGEHTFKIISSDGFASGKITVTKPNAAQMITNLYNSSTKTTVTNNSINYQYDTTNNLMKDIGDNIRYYGASPNNYIYFNCSDYSNQSSSTCETWRIIGVFDGKVKIMRNESIDDISYDDDTEDTYLQSISRDNDSNTAVDILKYNTSDKEAINGLAAEPTAGSGQNDYSKSSLQKILNNYYYNSLEYSGKSSYDFKLTGLQTTATRDIIFAATYNLGGSSTAVYPNQAYEDEKGTTVYSGNAVTWNGKIAIPYLSDYAYAADLSLCKNQLNSYNDSVCTANNWMYNIGITSNSFSTLTSYYGDGKSILILYANGMTVVSGATGARGTMPSLYLNSGLMIASGTGTSSNPYQLSV